MFAKISNEFIDLKQDYHQFNSGIVIDKYYSEIRKGGSAFMLINEQKKFWGFIKNIFLIKPIVRFAIFTGSGLVTPHLDGGSSVSLNFYLQTNNNDSTIFYDKINNNVLPYPNTKSYDINELSEITRFKAEKFDTYLMDVQTIHGIEKNSEEDRIIICFRWGFPYTFEQIYNSLQIDKVLWTKLRGH